MRVGINAHLLSFGQTYRGAGISRYIRNLLAHLSEALGEDDATVFLADRRLPPDLAAGKLEWAFSPLPTARPPVRILWEQVLAPAECLRRRLHVLHSAAYVQPLLCPCRSVLTIHDLSFLLMPEAFRPGNRVYLTTLTRLSARRADRIIAVSESTRRDAVRLLGVPPEKVTVVHHGVEPEFRPIRDPDVLAAFRRRRGLPEAYILFVGTLEPRKNVPTLLRAYAQARREFGVSQRLVVAGGKGWRYAPTLRLVEELGLRDDVLFPGFVPLHELPLWYNGASLFVYPSRYEGFGMPLLEAMACGTPVVTSRCSSLPEVVGDAGVLVEPDAVADLATALARVLGDGDYRADLSSRGLARAAGFSWDKATRQTVGVYRSCK